MNYCGVERTLLIAEILQQLMQLILLRGFTEEVKATALMEQVLTLCSTLTESLLTPTESQTELTINSEVTILQDPQHKDPAAVIAISHKEV